MRIPLIPEEGDPKMGFCEKRAKDIREKKDEENSV